MPIYIPTIFSSYLSPQKIYMMAKKSRTPIITYRKLLQEQIELQRRPKYIFFEVDYTLHENK